MLGNRRPIGEHRSRRFTMTYGEPWDVDPSRIPHDRYMAIYLDRMAKQGWVFRGVVKRYTEPTPTLDKERGALRVYCVDVLMSRPLRKMVIQVPDKAVPALLRHPKIGPLITDIS